MAPTDPKGLLEDFIQCYRSHSVLWDVTNKEYFHNKFLKRAAYEELLKVLRKYRKDACLADVKRKINTLRCTYRKELNKIKQSESSGLDKVYVPTLWWFDSMHFLSHLGQPVRSVPKVSDPFENEDESYNEKANCPIPKKKKIKRELPMACEYLAKDKTEKIHKEEYQFHNTARTWADKLRSLSRRRQLIVEKKINDIFFEAQMAEAFPEEESIRHGENGESSSTSFTSTQYKSSVLTHSQSPLDCMKPCSPYTSSESCPSPSTQRQQTPSPALSNIPSSSNPKNTSFKTVYILEN